MHSIVLLSGGMDSCVTTAIAISNSTSVSLLHISYKHRTASRELKSFIDIANYYKIKNRLIVNIDYLIKIGASALTDKKIKVPEFNDKRKKNEIPVTYVPFRNGNFLAIATSWAEAIGANNIYIGAVEEDSSGYPDTTKVFLKKIEAAINAGTKPETKIKIIAPLLHKKKSEIVKLGIKLNAPLHLSWSCYKNEKKACGICDSCVLRLNGFKEAGIDDKIPYIKKVI
ncbi:MAG TPA: 7-cyano-7-deazaguanine synthase QueC [bacterium]|nr:7-cyano-7-deazaguanine synthase QueC [bacterium]HOL47024.1 7-cyano-7-deazaguanine synthase QueC [bacterium]HPQ18474.1 7-cyano-7-deazaguanine synthase QueC [bacterium]